MITKLEIDGRDFTGSLITGRRQPFSLELRRDSSDGAVLYVLTNQFAVDGQAHDYLEKKFFAVSGSCTTEESEVKVTHSCCGGKEFTFYVNAETLSSDPYTCQTDFSLLQISPSTKARQVLESKPWWGEKPEVDSYLTTSIQHPRIKYCEPISFVGKVINILTFGLAGISGCNDEFHPSPLVYDVLSWNAQRAGLTFQSESIFETYPEYKRMALLIAQREQGTKDVNRNWIWGNAPIQTTSQLIEMLVKVFNAKYEISEGKLKIETVEWFEKNAKVLFDLEQEIERGRIIGNLSMFYPTGENKAYGRYEYTDDAVDAEGNRVAELFNDIIEWNSGGSSCLKGEYSNIVNFSPTHFHRDKKFQEYMKTITFDVRNGIEKGGNPGDLQLTRGMSSNMKLICLKPYTDPRSTAQVRPVDKGWTPEDLNRHMTFNHYLSFREDEPEGLYNRFHKYSSPTDSEYLRMGNIEWQPANFCEAFDVVIERGLRVSFMTPYGCAIPGSYEVNMDEGSIKFNDLKIRRNK